MQIGGKERALVFTINALIELKKDHGINILQDFKSTDPEAIRALAFVGLKYGHPQGKTLDFTIEEVGDWMTFEKTKEITRELLRQSTSESGKGEGNPGESLGDNSGRSLLES